LEVQSQDWKKTETGLDQDCPRLEIPKTIKDCNRGPVFSLSQFRKFKDRQKTSLTGLNWSSPELVTKYKHKCSLPTTTIPIPITAHTHLGIHTNNNAHDLHATMTARQMKTPACEQKQPPVNENDCLQMKPTAWEQR
jgi:hypothetical protein